MPILEDIVTNEEEAKLKFKLCAGNAPKVLTTLKIENNKLIEHKKQYFGEYLIPAHSNFSIELIFIENSKIKTFL